MHRLSRKAAVIAARPLTLMIASAVALAGMLAAPAAASLAASPGRPAGVNARADARPGAATGVITGLLDTVTGAPSGGRCVTAAGSTGQAMATTSAEGRYLLTGLRPGRYSLTVSDCPGIQATLPLGTIASSLPATATVTAGQVTTLRPSTILSLSAEGAIDGQPAGTAPLVVKDGAAAKTGGLAGTVTGNGHKLAGICAAAVAVHGEQVRLAVTSKSGQYRIRKLGAGRYIVVFLTGFAKCPSTSGNWLRQFYPDETTVLPRKPTSVKVQAGQTTTGIDARLKAGGQISGTVRTQAGKALGGMCVDFTGASASTRFLDTRLRTGKSGTYVWHSVFPGKYRAMFSSGCGSTSRLAAQWWRGADRIERATNISITGSEHVTGIDASMRPGAKVTGTVRAATAKGSPISGICVIAFDEGPIGFSPHAVTGKNGRFTLTGLSTGKYFFDFDPTCKTAHGDNFLFLDVQRHITAGRTFSGLNVAMRPAAGVSGVVTDSRGSAIRGVCVQVLAEPADIPLSDDAVTRPNGSYTIKRLVPGRHVVQFSGGCGNKGSVAPQFYDDQATSQSATRVKFVGGKVIGGIDAVMQPGGTVAGLVTDAAGHPLPNICAGVAPAGDFEEIGGFDDQVVTGPAGRYRIANLTPGAYEVSIGCLTGKFSTQWFPSEPDSAFAGAASVTTNHPTMINARLPRAGMITGTVTDKAGQPVRGECVDLTDPRNNQAVDADLFGDGTQTNRHGSYQLTGLTPGRYLVQFFNCIGHVKFGQQWSGHKLLEKSAAPVTVSSATTTGGINATLAPAALISGRVTSPSGKPVSGVCVSALSFAARDIEQARTNAAGEYTIRGLATAHYSLTFRPCGRPGSLATATLASIAAQAGTTRSGVNVRLTPAGTISGTLRAGISGQPDGAGTCVTAIPARSARNSPAAFESSEVTQTQARGHYTLRDLAPGSYKLYFNDVTCAYLGSDSGDFNDDVSSPVSFAAQWYKDRLTEAAADEVTVAASRATSGIDATLPAFGGLTGNVSTPTHAAVPGECITAVPQDTDLDPFFATPPTPETAIAGPEGNYSMIDLQPGRYKVEFSTGCGATGWATQWWAGASSASTAIVISVTPGTVTAGISATLHR